MRRKPDAAGDAVDEHFGSALAFLRALWELNHALERASRAMKRRLGVTGPERLFIRVVGRLPGTTPARVADILRVDRSSVTPLLKRLERRRLVSREPVESDRRSVRLYLTGAGARIDAMKRGTIEAAVTEILAGSARRHVEVTASTLGRIARQLLEKTSREDGRRVRVVRERSR